MGSVQGPHTRTTRAQKCTMGTGYPPQRRAAGRRRALTPDSPYNDERSPPRGSLQPTLRRATSRRARATKGQFRNPTPAPPAPRENGQRGPATRPKDGQPGEGDRLTPDAPPNGARHPPPADVLLPHPQRATPAHKSARCGAVAEAASPRPHQPATRPRDGQPEEGERRTSDAPHHGARYPPPHLAQPPASPAARDTPQGTHAKGRVPGLHTRTPALTWDWQRALNACPKDGQQGEDERLTTDVSNNCARHPPQIRLPATPRGRNASSQEHTLRGCCWVPVSAPAAP